MSTSKPTRAPRQFHHIKGRTRRRVKNKYDRFVTKGQEEFEAEEMKKNARRCIGMDGKVHWLDVARGIAQTIPDKETRERVLLEIDNTERQIL